jgi:hypothetical protein
MSLIFLNYGCHKNERQRGGVFAIFAGCLMCMMIFYKLSPKSTMVDTQINIIRRKTNYKTVYINDECMILVKLE